MSDYARILDYAAKDALATGNASKAIKGTEVGAEFDAIATMSSQKADKVVPTATGNVATLDTTGNLADGGQTIPSGTLLTTTNSVTVTGKALDLASNTITGTTSQFNTALSDGSFATLAGSETLTNKTLTSPTINSPTISSPTITGGTISSAATIDSIVATNLVDKSATETISGPWTFSTTPTYPLLTATAGDYIEAQTNTITSDGSVTLRKFLEIYAARSGTYRTVLSVVATGSTNTCTIQIYINGTATGTLRDATTTPTVYTEDFTVSAQDLIQAYIVDDPTRIITASLAIATGNPIASGVNYAYGGV